MASRMSASAPSRSHKIAIPLRPREKPVDLPEEYKSLMRNEFGVRYLESIGAAPSKSNLAMMRKYVPKEKLTFSTAWKSRGWTSDVLFISLQDPAQAKEVVQARQRRAAALDIGPIDRLPTALHERDAGGVGPSSPASPQAGAAGADEEDELQLTAPSGSMPFADGQRQFLYPYRHVSGPGKKKGKAPMMGDRAPSPTLLDDEMGGDLTAAGPSSAQQPQEEDDEFSVDDEEEDEDGGTGTRLPPIGGSAPAAASPQASPTRKGKYNFTTRDIMKYAPCTEREVLVELAAPLELHTRDILQYQLDFLSNFPFDRLKKGKEGSARASSVDQPDAATARLAKEEIAAPRTARFIGMLALFLYRFHMRERCRQPKDDTKLGALLCAVQQYFSALRRRMKTRRKLLMVVLPALLLSVRMSVEALFRHAFKKW